MLKARSFLRAQARAAQQLRASILTSAVCHGTPHAQCASMASRSLRLARRAGLALAVWTFVLSAEARADPSALAEADDALPSPLRIEHVLRYAREHRAEIAAARARARAAGERPAQVSALEDPTLSPSIDHLPFRLDGANVSLTFQQRFPLSGVLGQRDNAAKAQWRRAQSEVERVELDIELDAAGAFLMLQERRQRAAIVDEQRALAQQFVQTAAVRYAAGTGPEADGLRAEIEVARLESAVRSLVAEIRASEITLNASLGRSPRSAVPALDGSRAESSPPSAAEVQKTALLRRPELQAFQFDITRARAEVSVMQSEYTPMAMVDTGPAYTMTAGAGWMLKVGVSIPLWRGKLRAGVAEAEAQVAAAQADVVALRRVIEGEALASREAAVAARERFLALRDEIIPRARHVIDPALADYASGQLPLVSVIEAAQALWSAQADFLAAQFDLGLAWARLHRAMGETGAPR
jgi:cobalt-zinc-cadmium efflux system outer membrane protein